jgi:branched-chain amino acid transport system ATP-binding protein
VTKSDDRTVQPSRRDPLLECSHVTSGYGEVQVVHDLSLSVERGEVCALLGPNGAGKTTTLLTLSGELKPSQGSIRYAGDAAWLPLFQRARRGLGFVTEERSVFMQLTVAENLKVGRCDQEVALGLFPELIPRMRLRAGLLSGGEQQMLTLARALARDIDLLLIDEISLGLAPLATRRLLGAVRRAADERNLGVLLVEQQVTNALAVADRAYVLQRGRVVLSGTAANVAERLSDIEREYLS